VTTPSVKAGPVVAAGPPPDFSLLGGPLHQLGRRLGLVRGTNSVLLGLTIGAGLWLVIFALSVVEGVTGRFFTLEVIGVHARLLVVFPLFFVCESWVAPRMTAFVHTIAQSGVVPPGSLPALNTEVARIRRLKDAWWPEVLCLVAAVALALTGSRLQNLGESSGYDPTRPTLAAFVYFEVALTAFRSLVFLGVWKIALWSWFLWRVSRLNLHLLANHPDHDGGLGSLEGVHERFTPLVAAISVLEGAALAEDISTGTLAVTGVYPVIALLLLVDGALLLGGAAVREGAAAPGPDDCAQAPALPRTSTAATAAAVAKLGTTRVMTNLAECEDLSINPRRRHPVPPQA